MLEERIGWVINFVNWANESVFEPHDSILTGGNVFAERILKERADIRKARLLALFRCK